jgi:peptide/nickel transport system ATP-binding protein
VFDRYPHQLSGGQQQRVVIAMALMAEPSLLVMDEPTTGLDVTVEAAVLDLVRELRRKHNSALVFISHNLGTVVRVCDRIGVMYAGDLVEEGPIGSVFRNPRHPYTRGLLECLPVLGSDKHSSPLVPIPGQVPPALHRPQGCIFAGRCKHVEPGRCTTTRIETIAIPGESVHRVQCARALELPFWQRPQIAAAAAAAGDEQAADLVLDIDGLKKFYETSTSIFSGAEAYEIKALNDVSMSAKRGMTLAVVGESGCGKSTLAKVLMGLEKATGGKVALEGADIGGVRVEDRTSVVKGKLQMVFQNPDSTLNPSHSVGFAIERSLRRLKHLTGGRVREQARRLMEIVKLPADFVDRKPRQLSGGQKQRVAIARALAGDPDVMVADEPVSALDVSVQAQVLALLAEIRERLKLAMLFITHDLRVAAQVCDTVAVMSKGRVVEYGPAREVFGSPKHEYTRSLFAAAPGRSWAFGAAAAA